MTYSAGNAPDLDRFSRPETFTVTIITRTPECHICGRHAHPKFLKLWNGVDACGPCRDELEDEFKQHCGEYIEELTVDVETDPGIRL